ncbi:hypothetical protein JTB14_036961 [Gonioctena quinquepunctata]|nr:hypothetical protein JTB14_036961 [Gonioctena quinquepunctata]
MKSGVLLLTMAFLCGAIVYTHGCSCMPQHPQDQFCSSDFVILARVKRERILNGTKVYKVRVRKEYKISEKGQLALKSGRLITAPYDSMCGVQLDIGKLYVISATMVDYPTVSLQICDVSPKIRKTLAKFGGIFYGL